MCTSCLLCVYKLCTIQYNAIQCKTIQYNYHGKVQGHIQDNVLEYVQGDIHGNVKGNIKISRDQSNGGRHTLACGFVHQLSNIFS